MYKHINIDGEDQGHLKEKTLKYLEVCKLQRPIETMDSRVWVSEALCYQLMHNRAEWHWGFTHLFQCYKRHFYLSHDNQLSCWNRLLGSSCWLDSYPSSEVGVSLLKYSKIIHDPVKPPLTTSHHVLWAWLLSIFGSRCKLTWWLKRQ